MLKKVLKNSLIYGIAPQITAVANILVLPLITPNLTEFDFGINGIALSYVDGSRPSRSGGLLAAWRS